MTQQKTPAYTPGPWMADRSKNGYLVTGRSNTIVIARIFGQNGDNLNFAAAESQRDANARLIAAAPLLVEALQRLDAWTRSLSEQSDENALDLLDRYRRDVGDLQAETRAALKAAGVTP